MNLQVPNNGCNVDPFPQLIWKYHYDFPTDKLLPLINELKQATPKNSLLEQGAAFSTAAAPFDPPHTWPELQHFREWIAGPLDFMWKSFNYDPQGMSTVLNSWINTHKKGGETLEHNHNNVLFVVAAYIKLPPHSGYIQFRDPLEYHKSNTPMNPEEHLWQTIPCETNDLLIFPGWLKHRVQPNRTDDERIVMTWNIG